MRLRDRAFLAFEILSVSVARPHEESSIYTAAIDSHHPLVSSSHLLLHLRLRTVSNCLFAFHFHLDPHSRPHLLPFPLPLGRLVILTRYDPPVSIALSPPPTLTFIFRISDLNPSSLKALPLVRVTFLAFADKGVTEHQLLLNPHLYLFYLAHPISVAPSRC